MAEKKKSSNEKKGVENEESTTDNLSIDDVRV